MTVTTLVVLLLLQSPGNRSTQLPDTIRQMILAAYPQSELMVCGYDRPRQKSPSNFIQGDFNGDAKRDFAAIVKVKAPEPNCYCFVFLSTGAHYEMKVLTEPYMYCSPQKRLSLNTKGSEVYNYATESFTNLKNDAFTVYLEVCHTFIYQNGEFTVMNSCD